MADTNVNKSNETMQREQGKSDLDRREQARLDKDGREKGAIGGGDNRGQSSQTETRGQAHSSGQTMSGPSSTGPATSGQNDKNREFDKNRSEPAGR
jgi:hypothetical protein